MKISVIGCGYLGTVHAAAMASLGHDVVGIEVNENRLAALRAGRVPFFEPDLQEMLSSAIERGNLRFSGDIAEVAGSRMHFVCVGTPQTSGGISADMSYVQAAFEHLMPHLGDGDVVVGKSTVPVGTAAPLGEAVAGVGATLCWNPEFLREGRAVEDTISPDRIVAGVPDGAAGKRAAELLKVVYGEAISAGVPFIVTDYVTAELVKGAANAFLATKVSFINAMAEIAETVGADALELAEALGHDPRIGHRHLRAGLGFGGGCLPKDIRAFAARAEELELGTSVAFLREVDAINMRRRHRAVELAAEALEGQIGASRIAVLGAAFKAHSDDVRDSPALDVAVQLHELGAHVVVCDPAAIPNARTRYPDLTFEPDPEAALADADLVFIGTEWPEFTRQLEPERAAELVRRPVVIDGRNCLVRDAWETAGWRYIGMGRR